MSRVKQECVPPPMGEQATEIHINTNEIPDYVRDTLAAATLDLIHGILNQPGGREALDARIEARKTAGKTAPRRISQITASV